MIVQKEWDEDFKAKMIDAYQKCDIYAKSIPIEELTDKKMWQLFGTRIKFQKCATVRPKGNSFNVFKS